MNFRLTAILFGAVFVLAVVLLVLSYTSDDTGPPTDMLTEELAAAKTDQIDTLEIEREGGGKLKIVRTDKDKNRWDVVEPYAAKADPAAVNEVVSALMKAKPTAYPELSANPAVHGLDPVSLRVTLRWGDKASTVNLGDITIGGDKAVAFVTTSARPKRPMAVPRRSLDALFREPNPSGKAVSAVKWVGDFRTRSVFAADSRGAGDDVSGIVLKAKGKSISLAKSGAGWKFVAPAGWGDADPTGDTTATPGTFTGVRPLLGALTSLQATSPTDFVENPSPQDLEKYGLNPGNPDAVTVELVNKDNEKTVVVIGKKDSPLAPPVAPPGKFDLPGTGKVWVKVEGQAGVIRANGGDLSGLLAVVENPDPLRDRTLLAFDKARIDGLDLLGGAVKLRKVGPLAQWKLYGNPAAGDPQAASLTDVDRIINALTERRTVRAFPAPNPANFGPGEVVVRVWEGGFEASTDPKADPKAEPKEKSKPVTLTFGKKEGDAVNVKRVLADGTTTDYFLLPEKVKIGLGGEQVDLLAVATKSRLELLDRDLKGFSATTVGKLTVMGAANFDLDRRDPPKSADPLARPSWVFAADAVGPAGQKFKKDETADDSAVNGMLDILATTPTVSRWVDEAPSPEKLKEYGFAPGPRLRVIVGLKDAAPDDKDRTYEFGGDTTDPNYVYARQPGRPAVFTLPKFIYEKFTTADLRNRAIFKVDPSQVEKIELVGWGDKFGGKDVKLVMQKNKDGSWEILEGPTKYVVDPIKVSMFLNTLGSLQVRSYTADAVPAAAHGIGDPKQFFVVTLVAPGGAHHLYLRLGGPAEASGSTLYAVTNRVPGGQPVVTVDATPFKTYKEAPGAFAR